MSVHPITTTNFSVHISFHLYCIVVTTYESGHFRQSFSSYNLSSDFTPKLPFYAAQEQISDILPSRSSGTAGATPTSLCAALATTTTHCIHIIVYVRHFF
jgi:hypothetical protein